MFNAWNMNHPPKTNNDNENTNPSHNWLTEDACNAPPAAKSIVPTFNAGRLPWRSTNQCPANTAEMAAPALKPERF